MALYPGGDALSTSPREDREAQSAGPDSLFVVAKPAQFSWCQIIPVTAPDALYTQRGRFSFTTTTTAEIDALTALAVDLGAAWFNLPSPRLGALAFAVERGDEQAVERLRQQLLGRDADDALLTSSAELLALPHRHNARLEFDGTDSPIPQVALQTACRKVAILVELLAASPRLGLIAGSNALNVWAALRRHFVPFCSGRRSLHLVARGASAVGTGFSWGLRAWAQRVNAVAATRYGQQGPLIDPAPYGNVRAPWRALYATHPRTGLWVNRVEWELIEHAAVDAIVDACRRPAVDNWAVACLAAMGFTRPPDPDLDLFYRTLQHFGDLAARNERWQPANRLRPMRTERRRSEVDFLAALQDLGIRSTRRPIYYDGQPRTIWVLSSCPGCRTTENAKAFVKANGWLRCFRGSCDYSEDGAPALGMNAG